MAIIWKAPIGKTSDLLELSGNRELFWYGVTIGQIGFGVLASEKRQPTKRATDGFTAVPNSTLEVKQTLSAKAVTFRRRR